MGNIIRNRACLSLLSTRNLWRTIISPALREHSPPPVKRYKSVCADELWCTFHLLYIPECISFNKLRDMVPYKDGGMNQHNFTVLHFLYFSIKTSARRNIYRHGHHPVMLCFYLFFYFFRINTPAVVCRSWKQKMLTYKKHVGLEYQQPIPENSLIQFYERIVCE